MKLHIIVPSFNQGKYVNATMDSLTRDQSHDVITYFVDGGSKDDTMSVVKGYEQYLAYCVSEKDRGQTHAINKGFQKIKGHKFDFINWINSDDLLKPNIIEKLQSLAYEGNVKVVCGRCEDIDENGKLLKLREAFPGSAITSLFDALRHVGYCQPSTFYRFDVFEDLSPLPENLHFCMDYVLWLRFLFRYGFKDIKCSENVTLASFRRHEEAKSGASRRDGFRKEILEIYRDFSQYVEKFKKDGPFRWHLKVLYFRSVFSLNLLVMLRKRHIGLIEYLKSSVIVSWPVGIVLWFILKMFKWLVK